MKPLILLLPLLLAGCATYQQTRIVKATYHPTKSAIMLIGSEFEEAKMQMTQFCGAQRAQILEVDESTTQVGSKITPIQFGSRLPIIQTKNEYQTDRYLSFRCVDET